MIALPPMFMEQMAGQLGAEAEAFFRSYDAPRKSGLRLNRLKIPEGHPMQEALIARFGLSPVPWCQDGYYYAETVRPGKHPFHAAGLYYIQEPSAMIAAELLDPQPGELVLDLAAAPGGKTTQLASKMAGKGLLVANEIHPARAKILSENVERLGIANALVVQASPDQLSPVFAETFDRVLLDAPCSGEGMFRKDPEAIAEWSPEAVKACAARQRDILPHAAAMLKPGGTMVYSTCTFNTLENEETVRWFLDAHPEFELLREERLWPHQDESEGHYAALLRKKTGAASVSASACATESRPPAKSRNRHLPRQETSALDAYETFAAQDLPGFRLPEGGQPLLFGESLFWLPAEIELLGGAGKLRGLKVLRPGLHLGDMRARGRFEPNHALAMTVTANAARLVMELDPDGPETAAYLRGETLPAPADAKGWGIAAAGGFPLGWVKASGGQYKNHRPKGLRIM
jgi:NOL1/NOP2/sun family putative RNA methylase